MSEATEEAIHHCELLPEGEGGPLSEQIDTLVNNFLDGNV